MVKSVWRNLQRHRGILLRENMNYGTGSNQLIIEDIIYLDRNMAAHSAVDNIYHRYTVS